jgi:hypothetical protein
LKYDGSKLVGRITSSSGDYRLSVSNLASGSVRVSITEDVPRWQPADLLREDGLIPKELRVLKASSSLPLSIRNLPSDSFVALALDETEREVQILTRDPTYSD